MPDIKCLTEMVREHSLLTLTSIDVLKYPRSNCFVANLGRGRERPRIYLIHLHYEKLNYIFNSILREAAIFPWT